MGIAARQPSQCRRIFAITGNQEIGAGHLREGTNDLVKALDALEPPHEQEEWPVMNWLLRHRSGG